MEALHRACLPHHLLLPCISLLSRQRSAGPYRIWKKKKNGFSRVLFKCGGPWIVLLHPGDDVCCGIRRCVWLGSWALAKKNTHRRERERKETWQEMKRNSTHASNGESTVDDVKVFSLGQTDSDGRFLHLRNGHCIGRVTLLHEFLFDSLRTTA